MLKQDSKYSHRVYSIHNYISILRLQNVANVELAPFHFNLSNAPGYTTLIQVRHLIWLNFIDLKTIFQFRYNCTYHKNYIKLILGLCPFHRFFITIIFCKLHRVWNWHIALFSSYFILCSSKDISVKGNSNFVIEHYKKYCYSPFFKEWKFNQSHRVPTISFSINYLLFY